MQTTALAHDWAYAYRIDRGHPPQLPASTAERAAIAFDLVTVYGWTQERAGKTVGVDPQLLVGVAA